MERQFSAQKYIVKLLRGHYHALRDHCKVVRGQYTELRGHSKVVRGHYQYENADLWYREAILCSKLYGSY